MNEEREGKRRKGKELGSKTSCTTKLFRPCSDHAECATEEYF